MDPLDISRNPSKEIGKKTASPSTISSSSSSFDNIEAPSFLEFYDELSDSEDLTKAQREKRGIFKCLNRYVGTITNEEQQNERTPSAPPRKKSFSPPQAPSKSISSKSTHYTSSSSPSDGESMGRTIQLFGTTFEFQRDTTLVEFILVKGHVVLSIMKIRLVGCDLLALVELFIPVEGNVDKKLDHHLVEMTEQQVMSLVRETQLMVVVNLEGMVEKNELVEELMITVMDTKQNLIEFDSYKPIQVDLNIFHATYMLHLHVPRVD
nr:hypothetical protein [Tanacetum cinerariifolium]